MPRDLPTIDATPLIAFKALCVHLCPAGLRAAVAFFMSAGIEEVFFSIALRGLHERLNE